MTDPRDAADLAPVARRRLGAGAEEIRGLMARSRDVVLVAAIVGAITGLLVALFDHLVALDMLASVRRLPLPLLAIVPGVGLAVTAVIIYRFAGGSGSTADEYVKALHHADVPFDTKPVPARMLAAIDTLGTGGAGGYEGPSIYLGSAIGIALYERVRRSLRGVDRRAAIVAGAAAGVAAIFKAPATGAVFALEVPFHEDLARHSLLPAMVGAATGYTTFVALNGTDPLIPVSGHPTAGWVDIGMAVAIGLTCGLGARLHAKVMLAAKAVTVRYGVVWRVVAASIAMAGLLVLSHHFFEGRSLVIGPGYHSIAYALDPTRAVGLLILLFVARLVSTAVTVGGGGVVGMFVPLVVQGALAGRLIGDLFHTSDQSLCVVIGIAAFLGAGYRVPLAAVMFVAEATGRPAFVVPGLIAATIAQLMMGTTSVSKYQRPTRLGYLEQRLRLPIASVLVPDAPHAQLTDTLAQFFTEHISLARRRGVPIMDDEGLYQGLVLAGDVLAVPFEEWPERTLDSVVKVDTPTARPDWTLGQAMRSMVDGQVDFLPVVDDAGHLRGLVSSDAILDRSRFLEDLDVPE